MNAKRASREPFRLNDTLVEPGKRAVIEIPSAQLYTRTPLNIPVHVVHGRRSGPVLMVCAAIHGDELNGVEIIRRLLRMRALQRLRGTLIAVPVVNLFGFIHKSRYLPDRRDLNRCFPGSERGSLGSRMAWQFRTRVMEQATHVIDLHTAAVYRSNLPQIRTNLDTDINEGMARAFGVPVVLNAELRDGSLRAAAHESGIPVLTYEAGEALRLEEGSIRAGVRGVLNVMRHLGMLSRRPGSRPVPEPTVANSSTWVRAEHDGVFRPAVALGARIKKHRVLGRISSPFTTMDEEELVAPCDGILIGRNNQPLVNQGEALFHIARFEEVREVAQQLKAFRSDLRDETDPIVEDEDPIAP